MKVRSVRRRWAEAALGGLCSGCIASSTVPPSPPTGLSAQAGIRSATVTWIPLTDPNVLGYTVLPKQGGTLGAAVDVAGATSSSVLVTGLANGTTYSFTVVSHNSAASSAPSAPSAPVTTFDVPSPPVYPAGVSGNASVALSFGTPPTDGGLPISGYLVTVSSGGATQTVDAASSPVQITGLINGAAYTFTVVAQNAVGSSDSSAPSPPVVPATVPRPPYEVDALPGIRSEVVVWSPPFDDGGSAILGYQVTPYVGGVRDGAVVTVLGATTSATLSNLPNAATYQFSVLAFNGVGDGPAASLSAPVATYALPGAPTDVLGTAGNQQATVSWVGPANDGGQPVTSYRVTQFIGNTAQTHLTVGPDASPLVVSGLTNGTAYTFTVLAVTSVGKSAPTQSSLVIPATVPGPPTAVSVKTRAGPLVSWTAPMSDGGSAITSYLVTPLTGATAGTPVVAPGNTPQAVIPGLYSNRSYTFSVVARNVMGNGPAGNSPAVMIPCLDCSLGGWPMMNPGLGEFTDTPAMAVGDFNGDGIPDIALLGGPSETSLSVTILFGNGYGGFPTSTIVPVPGFSQGIVAGDVNGDGHLDFVVGGDSVFVELGRGDGTFSPPASNSFPAAGSSIGLGDFNGDGRPDLVLAGGGGIAQICTVLLGNGDGTFTVQGANACSGVDSTFAMALGDLNGDGIPDVVMAGFYNSQIVAELGGGGAFVFSGESSTGANPLSIALADLGTGTVDAVAANFGSNTVSVIPGDGRGGLAAPTSLPALITAPSAIAVADVNGDGHPDIIVANETALQTGFSILYGNGDRTFRPAVTFGVDNGTTDGPELTYLAVADFAGTGNKDLAIAQSGNGASVQVFPTGPRMAGPISYDLGAYSGAPFEGGLQGAMTGDFDGNGTEDAAVILGELSTPLVAVLLGKGDGTFNVEPVGYPAGTGPSGGAAGHFRSAPDLDLAIADAGSQSFTLLFGNGDGTFTSVSVAVGFEQGGIAAADFNGDGITDLALSDVAGGEVVILLGGTSGAFTIGQSLPVGPNPAAIVAGDLGNGHIDLAVGNRGGSSISILMGNGDGTFGVGNELTASSSPAAIVLADFNQDGKMDIAYGAGAVRFGNGDGTFGAESVYGTGVLNNGFFASGDFDGDGFPDLVADGAKILLNNGDGTFRAPLIFGYSFAGGAVDDFDGDGKPDILALGNFNNTTVYLARCLR